jgi:NAD(P)-dependent dehydrogenase (short-subunit alcohol dehydrogenase family)
MASPLVAIIAGVGPGTGAAVAKRFAAKYPVVLLARKATSYEPLVKEINDKGGKAVGFETDVSDEKSTGSLIEKVKSEFGADIGLAAAIFNASGPFSRKPFLETTTEDYTKSFDVTLFGAVNFTRAVLPLLASTAEKKPEHPPTLIFTGATASVKANALATPFNSAKFALRAFSSGIAKEFGPKGVHVGHAIIDGVIDTPRAKAWLTDAGPDAKIAADGIADAYWNLHTQPRSAFTWEIDIRPYVEKW